MSSKYVYYFGGERAEGNTGMRNLLGGKGANLAEMTNIGLPVPAGFTITTEVCIEFFEAKGKFTEGLKAQVNEAIKRVEAAMGMKFDEADNPLLLSVRSGARTSMPGMMDTVLNLGLNDDSIQGLIKKTNNPRFAYDSYRRFVNMYGDVVMGVRPESKDDIDPFEEILEAKREARGVKYDYELDVNALKELAAEYKAMIYERTGIEFPEEPIKQLWGSISAVFQSWYNDRAVAYRELNNIPEDWGTAVNVQAMVFGNMGDDSGTGVGFTRDPATGENIFYGEYLMNAQGEDVVAGIRTPHPIADMNQQLPEIFDELSRVRDTLDKHFRDMQDFEFTIQKDKLYMLQTRAGKRTGLASVRIAVELVHQGMISKQEALNRVEPEQLNQLLRPVFNVDEKRRVLREGGLLAKGLKAGPGAASGQVVFNAVDAVEWADKGKKIILVRIETSPEDIRGMKAAEGILTARGGMTSHAALVARQMGKVCVAGCGALNIDYKKRKIEVAGKIIKEGDWISLDGTEGQVINGELETYPSEIEQVLIHKTMKPEDSAVFGVFNEFMSWADEFRKLGIRTNADQPDQAAAAVAFGAEGIGLCRTEHMFFGGDRIVAVREMILSDTPEERKKALEKLLPMQRDDFIGIFRAMGNRPVTIRTLDPPLHEFLPHTDKEIEKLAAEMNITVEKLKHKIDSLKEFNPMLGHRGCRLGITFPEITEMQARAVFTAAAQVHREGGDVQPEVMIPLVGHMNELKQQKEIVIKVAEEVKRAFGVDFKYLVGTMIELPRAALTADKIAEQADFFSYGTNDLTQTTFGLSRDDAGSFVAQYLRERIWEEDPFIAIDREGVGELMRIGVEKGRKTRPNLKIGICGEHGGEPSSVEFCHDIGLDYVSCSPYRIPIARLAAAKAALKD
ncbi:MAG: pyruvate, phosphate dikinase [candidate division Zixibacteria bacterium]|nr:pyruvate, phosphate dikinase [Candidatus Tariuqbacter arcticus]